MKKAQSISINTIVIAVIALMVLIILVFVLGNQTGIFVQDVNSCDAVGGECDPGGDGVCPDGYTKIPRASCEETTSPEGPCCKQILPDSEEN